MSKLGNGRSLDDQHQTGKRHRPGKQTLIRRLFFLGLLALVSGTSGAALALLATTPLKHKHVNATPDRPDNLTSLVPVSLTRPINILVLGIDNSGHPHSGAVLPSEALAGNSDTMLLLRLDPETQQINILSLPRDTLVQTPTGIEKINEANVQGGASLAIKTVSQLLDGMAIDRYIRLDTEGFVHLVDALGGVTINVPKAMHYTDNSQHLQIHFTAGQQTLNGQHLQEYVRFRHDEWGDIGRVQRQQDVLKAIAQTLIQPATLGKLPQLLQVIQSNVDTDLALGEMLAIVHMTHGMDTHHMNLVMLPGRFSRQHEYPLSYWIEDPQAATTLLARYFNGSGTPQSQTTPTSHIQIAIANATDRPELAQALIRRLKARGFSNVYLTEHEIDTNPQTMTETQIIAQQGDPAAAALVQQAIGLGQVQVASTGDLASDVTIVLESDAATKLSHP